MKKVISFLTVLSFILIGTVNLIAQNTVNIIADLESNTNSSEGIIHVDCDPAIANLIGKPSSRVDGAGSSGYYERTVFRLQIYMGSNPNNARSEASSRQSSIRNHFPETSTYLHYEAPHWKLLAGDFFTREEANVFKQQLQQEFPQFGKEIYIVTDKVKIPIERGE